MYGEAEEFETLCNDKNNLSDDYIVFHFWEIHNTIRHGHKWMGKVSKDPLRWRILSWLGIVKTDNDKKKNTNVTIHRWWKCKWLEKKYQKRTKDVKLLKYLRLGHNLSICF